MGLRTYFQWHFGVIVKTSILEPRTSVWLSNMKYRWSSAFSAGTCVFRFYNVQNWYSFSRNCTWSWIWIFSWVSGMQGDPLWWCWVVAGPSQPGDHEPVRWQPLRPACLSLSVQYSVHFIYMTYSTLYYQIGFVLDDVTQSQARLS